MFIDEEDYQILCAKQIKFQELYQQACQQLGKTYVELQEIREKLPKLAKQMGLQF